MDEPDRRTLPFAGAPPSERADAARNRRRIIDAACRLVANRGTAALSLDEVAREAQLGVGTVYRRFGDRAGLLYALLDDGERRFQAAFTTGEPPLGPGAPAAERIRAFLHALVDQVATHRDLLLEAESAAPVARFSSGPYTVYRLHLSILLREARPAADPVFLADALLAPLSAAMIEYQRTQRGLSYADIKAGIDELLRLSGFLTR
ncbi:helix-turn-helix domain-containing protein [Actinophytocola sp.]|uniref:TetR/AcrR family transcriptional regulator n=1 Tax=Actinophytocola sp. TaxID=1872138 RepID=UPI002D7FCA08|nr:helix-turn-helix domain-containing protein [Actinophytocola sp.]HET9140271.1 helix-turn-helix domain-containing protein [Actinophytocola sp.]